MVTTVENEPEVDPAIDSVISTDTDTDIDTCADIDTGAHDVDDAGAAESVAVPKKRSIRWRSVLVYTTLPCFVLLLAIAAGWVKWVAWSHHQVDLARVESLHAATEGTIAMLSYHPDSVQNELDSAKARLTGPFRDSYSSLVDDVVAPAAIQKLISSMASVPAAASVSATQSHAVVLLFVNQTLAMGKDAPTNTNSCVRVGLDKIGNRWLISSFEPV